LKNNELIISKIREVFKSNKEITFDELKLFFQIQSPYIKQSAIKTRLNRLVKQGIISRIGRGKYTLGQRKIYIPQIDKPLQTIAKKIQTEFPELKFCIWHTSWISQFMVHQPTKHYTIIEPESDSDQRTLYSETVFRYLQTRYKNVFHKPDKETIQNYVSEHTDSIIVLPLVSEAPTQKVNNITTISLEKMLVDIFCDETIFSAEQGNEKATIFTEAFNKYTINNSKLLRYAARRTNRKELDKFLIELKVKNEK
jgi:predicted transcriptional regulator